MDVFTAIADPIRRDIVAMLAKKDRTAGDIAENFDVTGPAISRHLRVLRESGMVTFDQDGQRRIYRLAPQALHEVDAWMREQLDTWSARFDALGQHLNRMARRKRK